MQSFFEEVKRRKVLRVAIAYVVAGWVLLQVGDVLIGLLELPGWSGKLLVAVTVIGLPIAIVLSWLYDWTPTGIVTTGNEQAATPQPFSFSEPEPIDVSTLTVATPRLGKLVGRRNEREIVRQCLDDAKSGTGGLVLIGGEPGVGKSRLGEESLQLGRAASMLPLTGHAYEERGTPFVTSAEILEEAARALPEDALRNALGNTAPEIARLLPDLRRDFPGIPQPTELPPEQQQRFLFNAVLEFLTRLSRSSAIVFMLDDMHWADESSIALLEHLAPHLPKLPILMVVTYRNVDADMREPFKRALAQLSRQNFVTRIALRRLTRDDVAELLGVLGGPDTPSQVVDAIYEETNGNAFFIQSVYQHLADEGRLFDEHGQWLTDIDTKALAVPDSVRLVTGRRIARLSQETQDVLAIAAVMGLRFRLPVLQAAVKDRDRVIDAIEETEAAHLLKQSTGGRELRYEFVHALARQTLLDSLSAPRQQQLHQRIAEAIEHNYGDDAKRHAADLAFHLVEAGANVDTSKVVHWCQVAGTNAIAAAAIEEAVRYFGTALSLTGDADREARADLLHQGGSARLSLGDKPGFQMDLDEAFSIYEEEGLSEKAARVACELSYILVWNAQPDLAHALVSRALELIGEKESSGRCLLLSARGLAYSIGKKPGGAAASERSHDAAVTMARHLADPSLLAEVLPNQALGHWHRLSAGGRAPAHEAAALLRKTNQGWNLGHCLWMEKVGLMFAGRFDEAERIDDELLPLAERYGDFGSLGLSPLVSTTIHQARGDLEASSQALERSTRFFDAGGFPWGFYNDGYHAINALLLGDDQEARRAVDAIGTDPLRDNVWAGTDIGYWLSGKAWLGDDDILSGYQKVKADIPEPGTTMPAGGVVLLKGSIEALIVAGETQEAAELYPAICDFIQSGLSLLEFTFGLHERFAGMAAAAGRDWAAAEKHFARALELAEDLPHRVDQARVRYWYARMLLDRDQSGDRDRAAKLLADARAVSEQLGMKGMTRWIDELPGH